MTAALWTGARAWFLGAPLYLPEEWLTPSARQRARIPAAVRFQEKWRQALRLLRQLRAAGLTLTAVIADAEFGDVTTFRAALHRLRLPYALGISSHLTVFTDAPATCSSRRPIAAVGRGPALRMVTASAAIAVREVADAAATTRLAPCDLAQWHAAAADGPLRRRPRHPRARVAARAAGPRGLVAVRRGAGRQDAAQVLLRRTPRHRVAAGARAAWRINAGRSSSSTKNSKASSGSIISKAEVIPAGSIMSC